MLNEATDDERRRELEFMVAALKKVPAEPAETFREAIQAVWLMQLMIQVLGDSSLCGRPDNYLYPYYKRDIESWIITDDEVFAADGDLVTVADDFGLCGCDLLQCFYRFFRFAFLENAEDRVDEDDRHDDDNVSGELPMIQRNAVVDFHACGNDSGNDEDDGHRFCELFEESVEKGFFFAFGKLIFAVLFKTLCGFCGGKTGFCNRKLGKHVF